MTGDLVTPRSAGEGWQLETQEEQNSLSLRGVSLSSMQTFT